MKLKILNTKNTESGSLTLPEQFSEDVRTDLISRAVLAIQANKRQPYGADPMAGKKHSVDLSKRRRDYKGVYGKGKSRTPSKVLSRNGSQMNIVGATVPQTVGGRNAHPPKAEKIWDVKINDTERKKAIRSAISATVNKDVVSNRGHKVPAQYPFVLDTDFEALTKTKDFRLALASLGFGDELKRSGTLRIRAGKGKMRGRKYKKTVGPLIVVSEKCGALKAAKNIPGISVVLVSQLNAEDLAPGCAAGRATLFTKAAVEKIKDAKLFL